MTGFFVAETASVAAALEAMGLSETARSVLLRQIELLRSGYTGELRTVCKDGGVRSFQESVVYQGEELRLGNWRIS